MIKVGRHTFPDGAAQWSPGRVSTTIDLGTVVVPDTLATTEAQRVGWAKGMLLSLAGMAGDLAPITSDDLPEIDGLYRVESISPSTLPVSLADGVIDAGTINVTRLSGGVARAEHVITGGKRTVTAPVTAFPTASTFGWVPAWVSASATVDAEVITDTGQKVYRVTAPAPGHTAVPFAVPVADWYAGAATVEIELAGLWWPIAGDIIPAGRKIRISNGVVRVTLKATTAGATQNVDPLWEQWSGTTWLPVQLTVSDTSGLTSWRSVDGAQVIRNDPATVEIRTWGRRVTILGAAQAVPWSCVWSLRRGCSTIEVTPDRTGVALRWNSTSAIAATWVSGVAYGIKLDSVPQLNIVAANSIAYDMSAPSNVRDGTTTPGRWALSKATPYDARAEWHRWSTISDRLLP